jgi:hypothetical protein
VRESDGEKCRRNSDRVVQAECTHLDKSGRQVFAGDAVYKSRKINLNKENQNKSRKSE